MTAPLVQLRAGKLILDGGVLRPDARKGLIRVNRDEHDILHFQWGERDAAGALVGELEIDQIIFPGEASFEKIPRPGSRVFTLKFAEEADRTLFFWAQENAAENDDAIIQSVNLALSSVLNGMDEDTLGDQPMSLELPQDPNATPATDSNPRSANPDRVAGGGGGGGTGGIFEAGGIGASQLAAALGNILSGSGVEAAAGGSSSNPNNTIGAALRMGPPLGEVLKAERITPLLDNATLVERVAPFLPEEHRSQAAMAEIVNSPQFKHQLDVLTQALATGQIDTSQFGLGPPAFGVAEFLKAIQREAEKEKKDSEVSEQKDEKKEGEGGSGGS
ncbi:hypothetical protein Ndes2526A_g00450 [Nannochloris sp. 'desiccata']